MNERMLDVFGFTNYCEQNHFMTTMTESERKEYVERLNSYKEMYEKYLKLSLQDRMIIGIILREENPEMMNYILEKERLFLLSYGDKKERLYACMSRQAQKFIKKLKDEKGSEGCMNEK